MEDLESLFWPMGTTPERYCGPFITFPTCWTIITQWNSMQSWKVVYISALFLEKWPTPHFHGTQYSDSTYKLLTPSISKGKPFFRWRRQLSQVQAHGSHFPAHDFFSIDSGSDCFFGVPCSLMVTQTVSELSSGHLQIGQCDIIRLESDFFCPDSPCDSKIGPGAEELSINM
jgi:hypothetical protein